MARKTRILLGVFAGLLVLVLAAALWPRRTAGPDLKVAGWGPGQKVDKSEEDGPIDRIELTVDGKTTTLARAGKTWTVSPPDGARADRFRVRQMIDAFREDVQAVLGTRVADGDWKTFGLDPAGAVKVVLYKGGAPAAALEVGANRKPEQGYGEGDTFVRVPGQDRAWRVIDRNLRRPFDDLKALRDRKLSDFDAGDVVALSIRAPGAADPADREIELTSEAKPGTGDAAKDRKPERTWRFVRPEGVAAGDVRTFANTLAGLYAQEWLDALPPGVDLDAGATTIAATLDGGRKATFRVSATREESAFVAVEGMAGYAKVAKTTGDSLRKKVVDLRDRSLLGAKREEIASVAIVDGAKRVAFERDGNGFRALEPAGLPLGRAQVDLLLADLETLRADAIVAPSAAAGLETGLDAPAATLTVRTKDGRTRVVQVGREGEKGNVYASVAGSPDVYVVAQWMLNKVRKGPQDLRNRKLFDFEADQVAGVELVHKDETVTLARDASRPADAPFVATTPRDEKNLKAETVRTLVSSLAGLTVKDFATDRTPKTAGLGAGEELRVTVTLKDGSRHVLRVSAEKLASDPFGTSPTEPGFKDAVFTLNTYQVKNFQKRLKELL